MRNYVIINGVNSLTIQGLAIKTLPPITKPIQRNLREEIDGRDGDIVTTLGYGAYDKTIEIGLFGTFDIDEVIAYFNQKGTITFSNEADKVYYFEALDQVDYAELLKFRTANVVLHCQPFKYPTEETPLVEEYEYVEATGTNVTLDNTAEAIFNKIELQGNTSQDGTPTPSNPIPIHVVSGDNYIDICGKNLFDGELEAGTIDANGNNINSTDRVRTKNFTRVVPNEQYYLSSNFGSINNSVSNAVYGRCYDENKTYIQNLNITKNSSFTIPNNIYYFRWQYIVGNANQTTAIENHEIMLEKNSTVTTYEAYTGETYPLSLGNLEMASIPNTNYKDVFVKEGDTWYKAEQIKKVTLDGTESGWGVTNTGTPNWYYRLSYTTDAAPTDYAFSNYYILANIGNSNINQGFGITGGYFRFRFGNEDTIANHKTWLGTHN